MLAYIARRILLSGFTMEIMSVVIFVVIQLPEGDFVDSLIREARQASGDYSENLEKRLREYYGLDHPSHVQYWKWVSRIVTKLEFGHGFGHISPRGGYQDSYRRPEPIRETIRQPVQMTIFLTAFTISLTWTLGIPIGIYSAVRQHTIGDYLFTFVGFSGLAVPDFLLGLVLMYLFFAYFDMSVGASSQGNTARRLRAGLSSWTCSSISSFLASCWARRVPPASSASCGTTCWTSLASPT